MNVSAKIEKLAHERDQDRGRRKSIVSSEVDKARATRRSSRLTRQLMAILVAHSRDA